MTLTLIIKSSAHNKYKWKKQFKTNQYLADKDNRYKPVQYNLLYFHGVSCTFACNELKLSCTKYIEKSKSIYAKSKQTVTHQRFTSIHVRRLCYVSWLSLPSAIAATLGPKWQTCGENFAIVAVVFNTNDIMSIRTLLVSINTRHLSYLKVLCLLASLPFWSRQSTP